MSGEIKFTYHNRNYSLQENGKLNRWDLKKLEKLGSLWNSVNNGDKKLDKDEATVLSQIHQILGNAEVWTKEAVGNLINEFNQTYEEKTAENVLKFLGDKIDAQNEEKLKVEQEKQQAIANKATAESYGDFKAAFDEASKVEGFDEKTFVEEFLAKKLEYAQKFSDYETYKAQKLADKSTLAEKDIVSMFIEDKLKAAIEMPGYLDELNEVKDTEGFDIYKFTQEFIANKEAAEAAAELQRQQAAEALKQQQLQQQQAAAALEAKYSHEYTIKQDETLGFIAKKILQDGGNPKPTRAEIMKLVNEIAEMNGIDKNTYLIRVGQKIKLPVANLTGVQTITSGRKSGSSGGTTETVQVMVEESAAVDRTSSAKMETKQISTIDEARGQVKQLVEEVYGNYSGTVREMWKDTITPGNIAYLFDEYKTYKASRFYQPENITHGSLVTKFIGMNNISTGFDKEETVEYLFTPLLARANQLGFGMGLDINKIKSMETEQIAQLANQLVSLIIKKDAENGAVVKTVYVSTEDPNRMYSTAALEASIRDSKARGTMTDKRRAMFAKEEEKLALLKKYGVEEYNEEILAQLREKELTIAQIQAQTKEIVGSIKFKDLNATKTALSKITKYNIAYVLKQHAASRSQTPAALIHNLDNIETVGKNYSWNDSLNILVKPLLERANDLKLSNVPDFNSVSKMTEGEIGKLVQRLVDEIQANETLK